MKPRKWIIIVAVFFLTIISALYLATRFLEKNRNLENLLIQGISPYIHGTFTVDKLRIGFFAIYLHNVTFNLPTNSLFVKVRDIKIGFSLVRLLQYRDPSYAVGRIILINPCLDILVNSHQQTTTAAIDPVGVKVAMPKQLPVEFLTVKKGIIRLVDNRDRAYVIGEHLEGKVVDNLKELVWDLDGRMSSTRNNIKLSGTVSWVHQNNSLALKIVNAKIKEPLELPGLTINRGILSGILSMSFPDTFSISSMKAQGTLTVENASMIAGSSGEKIDSVQIRSSIHDSKLTFDSLRCRWKGLQLFGHGHWDIAGVDTCFVTASAENIRLDSLLEDFPDSIQKGDARASVTISKQSKHDGVNVSLQGLIPSISGFSPKINAAFFIRKKSVQLQMLAITTPGIRLEGSGSSSISEPFTYAFQYHADIDSVPLDVPVKGVLSVQGSVSGVGNKPQISAVISADDISVQGNALGPLYCRMTVKNDLCSFATISEKQSFAEIRGSISKIYSDKMAAECAFKIGKEQINSFLKRNPAMLLLDSASIEGTAHGWGDRVTVNLNARAGNSMFHGASTLTVKKILNKISWNLIPKNLVIGQTPVNFTASGHLDSTSVSVDSITARGLKGSGKIFTSGATPRIDANVWYNLSTNDIKYWFGTTIPLDSGNVSGAVRVVGPLDKVVLNSELHMRNIASNGMSGLQSDAIIQMSNGVFRILPAKISKDGRPFLTIDTTIFTDTGLVAFSGSIINGDIRTFASPLAPDLDIDGTVTGWFKSRPEGLPVMFNVSSPLVSIDKWKVDSIHVAGSITKNEIKVDSLFATDGNRVKVNGSAVVPFSALSDAPGDKDTLTVKVHATGDLLASMKANYESPIAGHGLGTASFTLKAAGGEMRITEGKVEIPRGTLQLKPFVLDDIKEFTFSMRVDEAQRVHTRLGGIIRKHPIVIFSSHQIPAGYEPLKIGDLDMGVLLVETSKGGIDIHLPGFMDIGERGIVEFQGRPPFSNFALSGPLDKLKINGTWILRDVEFTFPMLNTHEIPWTFDPFPFISWNLDLKPGNNRVMYYWDLSGKHKRFMRLVEGYLDPGSVFKVRGRDLDKTFKLQGAIHAYKGTVYYGRAFDRNLDVGVEFMPKKLPGGKGFDNMPVLWGSAEAFSDSSRMDRIKVTALIRDPLSGAISERGRLVDAPTPNITFHVSSDKESDEPGLAERDFYKETGAHFASVEGAGEFVSSFGEQYFHRYLLQRFERRLAKSIGLDVFNIETSIASNYFNKLYNRQFEGLVNQDDILALANVGVTVGRYFFRDYLFFKARGELIPIDTMLTPEYSVGLELQPSRYLSMDFNYGIHKNETAFEQNPRVNLQLRLPITRLRNLMKF